MLNVRRADLDEDAGAAAGAAAADHLVAERRDWVAVNTIIEERTVRDLIPKVKAAGGQGIVEYPLNKIVVCEGDAVATIVESSSSTIDAR